MTIAWNEGDHWHPCPECGAEWSNGDCEAGFCNLEATERGTCPVCVGHADMESLFEPVERDEDEEL